MDLNSKSGKVLIALMLTSLVVASGCVSNAPIDCGSDESCFADAMESCSAATVRTSEKEETFGDLDVSYFVSASTLGIEASSCISEVVIEDLEMTGNLTGAPGRLLYLMWTSVDSPLRCKTEGPIDLDMAGILSSSARCTGSLIDTLEEAFTYKEGTPQNVTTKKIEVLESSFCVGGKKIVAYIRNIGTSELNMSEDVRLVYAGNQTEIPVEWLDFSGSGSLEVLYPYKMAQFNLQTVPGTLYEYEVIVDSTSYPLFVQC